MPNRTHYFTEEQAEQLAEIVVTTGMSASEVLRQLISREYIARHPDLQKMGAVDMDNLPRPLRGAKVPLITTEK